MAVPSEITRAMVIVAEHVAEGGSLWCRRGVIWSSVPAPAPVQADHAAVVGAMPWCVPSDTRRAQWGAS